MRSAIALGFILCSVFSSALAEQLVNQRLVFSSEQDRVEYRLSLSALKKVNSETIADREVLLFGRLQRQTWEFNSEVSIKEAWNMLAERFDGIPADELFSCRGLACGSSNAWANERFAIQQLYGLDQSQRYQVLNSEDGKRVDILYFVQRGNKRIYAQIDSVFLDEAMQDIAPSASSINAAIERRGYVVVPVVAQASNFDKALLDELVRALKIKPIAQFYVVGHAYSAGTQAESAASGLALAQSLAEQLQQRGIAASRLEVHSVGALAPRTVLKKSRVELVLK